MPRERKNALHPSLAIIGDNIRTIIKERGLRVEDVAEDSGIAPETLRRYLLGTHQEMGISKIVKISKAIGLDDWNKLFRGL